MKKYKEEIIKVPRFSEENGFYTTKARSKLMGKIKGKETKPEQKLRKALWSLGIRYRKNVRKLPGSPDVVISRYKLIVFVDGEFWHGYNWSVRRDKLKANRDFWIPKIERNMQRDRQNNQQLRYRGWAVMRFWEYEIKKEFGAVLHKICQYIDEYEKYHL